MREDEARAWIKERFGEAGTARMERLVELIRLESGRQNLVAASTLDSIWVRHIVDSAQLIGLAADTTGTWLDIGTGAGFPGLVVAALTERDVILTEPRGRRSEFLRYCVEELNVSGRTTVMTTKIERVTTPAAVISARAVAKLDILFAAAQQCYTWNTLWLFPKGRSAVEEIASARETWHGRFHVERSVTDEESLVVVAKEVSRR